MLQTGASMLRAGRQIESPLPVPLGGWAWLISSCHLSSPRGAKAAVAGKKPRRRDVWTPGRRCKPTITWPLIQHGSWNYEIYVCRTHIIIDVSHNPVKFTTCPYLLLFYASTGRGKYIGYGLHWVFGGALRSWYISLCFTAAGHGTHSKGLDEMRGFLHCLVTYIYSKSLEH